MSKWSDKTLQAICDLAMSVDGCHSISVRPAITAPRGIEQDCDVGVVKTEWVDQRGPGFSGDDYHGTVTWKLGNFHVIASY